MKNKGSNNFLQGKDGSLHSDVRRDFYDTTKGIAKKACCNSFYYRPNPNWSESLLARTNE